MTTVYQENDLDKEFENFWSKVNCYSVIRFPYDQRCDFVRRANSCIYGTNFVPYIHLMACSFKCRNRFEEHVFVGLFMILCYVLLLCAGHVADVYYSPALKVISRVLHMNDHLAGVTIMALCNTIPDLLYQITIVNDRECVFANDIGTALFVVMFIGGLVCYVTTFEMHAFNTVRDLLFLIFGSLLLELSLYTDRTINYHEIIGMILVYVAYLIVNVLDLIMIKYTLKLLRRELLELNEMPDSPEHLAKIKSLTGEINKLSKEERVQILKRRTTNPRQQNFTFMTQVPNEHEQLEIEQKRDSRYVDMNRGLFKEFILAFKPIKFEVWRNAGIIERIFLVTRVPVVIICTIYIPLVDYEEPKNGWSKLLNCIQIWLSPAVTIILGKSLIFRSKERMWYASIPQNAVYGLYSLVLTVPLSIFIFCQSDTRSPPKYHWIFSILNLMGSVFLIFQCTTELSVMFEMIGYLYGISDQFMSTTVITATNCLGDLATIVTMALQGYEKMAYAATIGGPLLVVLLHCGSVMGVKTALGQHITWYAMVGNYGGILFVLFTLSLAMTLLWACLLNFHARRSVGIFSMSIYGLYIIFAILINMGIISPYEHQVVNDEIYKYEV
ncbi:PREDICTED: sodium/potassium/calcium exchanger 6, mitochondrial-like [Drosophila arizonae]|uniref:Sodium/potassium/calcium exchanger 6, mitochondrial-like n=1 Tax=Drosophila arizonae TaxID=7263 RepID=A0ABM1NP07_DROAR|nr:PREDICTED: sodium/potassium/calcium exchanger 6, mitochondrial-like [Drosophila arizonae]